MKKKKTQGRRFCFRITAAVWRHEQFFQRCQPPPCRSLPHGEQAACHCRVQVVRTSCTSNSQSAHQPICRASLRQVYRLHFYGLLMDNDSRRQTGSRDCMLCLMQRATIVSLLCFGFFFCSQWTYCASSSHSWSVGAKPSGSICIIFWIIYASTVAQQCKLTGMFFYQSVVCRKCVSPCVDVSDVWKCSGFNLKPLHRPFLYYSIVKAWGRLQKAV